MARRALPRSRSAIGVLALCCILIYLAIVQPSGTCLVVGPPVQRGAQAVSRPFRCIWCCSHEAARHTLWGSRASKKTHLIHNKCSYYELVAIHWTLFNIQVGYCIGRMKVKRLFVLSVLDIGSSDHEHNNDKQHDCNGLADSCVQHRCVWPPSASFSMAETTVPGDSLSAIDGRDAALLFGRQRRQRGAFK